MYYPRTIATSPLASPPLRDDELAQASALAGALVDACARAVRAPRSSLQACVIALLSGGHVMIEDVPGVGKTVLAKSLARAAGCDYSRVQCTADLLPADVTGVTVWDQNAGAFLFRPGPVFANVILVDEINRASPKTQSALLECMEEGQVTVDGSTRALPQPFMIIATQNPVEYEGTYPLPEAQLDRFLFKLHVGYPTAEQEIEVLARHDRGLDPHDLEAAGVRPVASAADLARARSEIDDLTVEPPVLGYIVEIARATRVSPSLTLGVSPRGAASLLHAAKAWAWLAGRGFVTPDEVKAVAKPALRHRLQLRPEVELEGATADGVLDGILATVPAPR